MNELGDAGPATWLAAAAARSPGRAALFVADRRYDYLELLRRAMAIAEALRAQGGATLAVQTGEQWQRALTLHAALLAGRPLLPLAPGLPDGDRRGLLQQAGTTEVFDEQAIDELLVQAGDFPPEAVPPAAGTGPRLLIATSGSSAAPKLVALDDRQLTASVIAANACLGVSSRSVWLACLPLVHIGGLAVLLRCARAAATVVLHQGFDPDAVMADLIRRRVTHISLVPTMLARLLESGITSAASLEVALIGGAPLPRSLARRALAAGWPLWLSYGMTETAAMLATRRLSSADGDGPLPVGPALPGYRLRIVDEQGRPASGEGLIEVAGAAVAAPGWLTTGDRGRLDGDGVLTVLGRADGVINSGGEKVQPERVEDLLSGCPGIDRVAVSGRPDPLWGERVVAFYCGDAEVSAVEAWCRERLSGALRPREVHRVAALPLTANGKLDRVALAGMRGDSRRLYLVPSR